MLTRESIRDGYVQRMAAMADMGAKPLSEAELEASIAATLAGRPPGADVWVFGYGSLIWNPAFHFAERRIGAIHGFHRAYCLWSNMGRGTPERPGLMLGLERGGSCRGVALRIAPEDVDSELDIVWRREMVSGAYVPRWVSVSSAEGTFQAVTFAINREHSRYTGALGEEQIVNTVAMASGNLGTCCEYLFNTVEHLKELGLTDRRLFRLAERVKARQAELVP
jgi:cation transport protein ChaC